MINAKYNKIDYKQLTEWLLTAYELGLINKTNYRDLINKALNDDNERFCEDCECLLTEYDEDDICVKCNNKMRD